MYQGKNGSRNKKDGSQTINNKNGKYQGGRKPLPPRHGGEEAVEGIVFGRNEVRELLRSGRSVDKLFIRDRTFDKSPRGVRIFADKLIYLRKSVLLD